MHGYSVINAWPALHFLAVLLGIAYTGNIVGVGNVVLRFPQNISLLEVMNDVRKTLYSPTAHSYGVPRSTHAGTKVLSCSPVSLPKISCSSNALLHYNYPGHCRRRHHRHHHHDHHPHATQSQPPPRPRPLLRCDGNLSRNHSDGTRNNSCLGHDRIARRTDYVVASRRHVAHGANDILPLRL